MRRVYIMPETQWVSIVVEVNVVLLKCQLHSKALIHPKWQLVFDTWVHILALLSTGWMHADKEVFSLL